MATLVATADPTTGTVRVDVVQILARDQFTRVVANSWGTATTGQVWTQSGGAAADYSVTGTVGQHSLTSVAVSRNTLLPVAADADMETMVAATVPVLALTQPIVIQHGARVTDTSNYYAVRVDINPVNPPTISLIKVVLGVQTILASQAALQNHVAGATWNLSISVCGHEVKCKAWRTTVTEPDWMLTANDFSLTTGTNVLCRSQLTTGNTNGLPVNITWDNLAVGIGGGIRLWRVTPDGTRTEVRGSPFNTEEVTATSTSGTATMYDNEAPFDVNVFYVLTSGCNTVVEATSNTVNLSSGGSGWLRDPQDPTRNLVLNVDDVFFDECVDQDVIVFSGLGERVYENASGIFDIIDDRRPVTVSQTRKNLAQTLLLTSFSLDDVDALEDIFDPGRILVLSLPVVYGFGHRSFGTDYITCFDISSDFVGVDQGVTVRSWVVPFRLSYAPVDTDEGGTGGNGIGGGGATYAELAASALGTTYATLTASGETYLQVAQGVGY